MTDPDAVAATRPGLPHQIDHRHADVSGGWLRAATFGAMDGLVSNTALIAGVAASASAHAVVLAGVAGLLAGAFSMALGEYTSVTTANEQSSPRCASSAARFRKYPDEERAELVAMLIDMGMTEDTATKATEEIHRDETRALNFHLVQELGVDPSEKPSPWVAAGVVVPDVRDRRGHPADPVPARLLVAVARAGLRRRRAAGRRRRGGALHPKGAVARVVAAVGLRRRSRSRRPTSSGT